MYPTSPLTTKKDLLNSFKVSKLHKNKFVFPAYSYRSNLNEKRKYEEFYRIKKIKKKKNPYLLIMTMLMLDSSIFPQKKLVK